MNSCGESVRGTLQRHPDIRSVYAVAEIPGSKVFAVELNDATEPQTADLSRTRSEFADGVGCALLVSPTTGSS